MNRDGRHLLAGALTLLALQLFWAMPVEGQRRGRQAQNQGGERAPLSIGVHGGWDDLSRGTVLGAQLRVPVSADGRVEVVPSGNVTFVTGLKEYQLNVDAAYTLGGRNAGLYVAGGLAVRNTVFSGPDKETKVGFGLAGGLRTGSGDAPLGIQLEYRQIFVDSDLRPRVLTFGLNFPLG